MFPRLLVALLVVPLLAGCADDAPTRPAPDDGPMLLATTTTGVLRGVVVDEAIRPVVNVNVVARGPNGEERVAVTDEGGLFGMADLAPGTWFVTASKIAYTEVQQSVEVVAGVSDPPVVKILVSIIPGAEPFLVDIKVEAFIQCIIPGANVCAIVNLYPCALAGMCDPLLDDTSFIVIHDELVALQRTPDWLQTEVLWETTQAVTPGLAILYSNYNADSPGRGSEQGAVRGNSPLVYFMGQETLAEWEVGTARGLGHEIFGHTEATSAIGSVGFVVNQRVDFFMHSFYGYAPPEGWQFSRDGAHPPPV